MRMPCATSSIAIALGSNLGEREERLREAIRSLSETLTGIRVGGLYESEPVGGAPQPRYLNTAIVGRAHLAPEQLLAVLKFLELRAGRRRGPRWGPRPLDLDLLLYGDIERSAPELTLPHPQLRHRAFVLAPLADAAPELRLPPDGASVTSLLAALESTEGLQQVTWSVSSQPNGMSP